MRTFDIQPFLLAILLMTGCRGYNSEELHSQLVAAAKSGRVDLADIIPGTWSRVFIFGPYTSTEQIRECER